MAKIVKVIISNIIKKIDRSYDYYYPFEDNAVGKRVIVPFGKANTPRKAFVLECYEGADNEPLKQVIDTLDQSAVISPEQIPLIHFLKNRYFIPYYRALSCLLPTGLDYKVKKAYCYTGASYDDKYESLVKFVTSKKKAVTEEKIPHQLSSLIRSAVKDGVLAEQAQGKRNLGDLADKMLSLAVSPEMASSYLENLPSRFEGQRDLLQILLDTPNVSVKEAL